MDTIRHIGDRAQVPPPKKDRRPRDEDRESFRRELDEAAEHDHPSLRDEIVVPRPRGERPIAPPCEDEVGYRVDVEA
jgi:hypothetical protein